MPRKPRENSSIGVYHILLRCVRNDKFFRAESDYNKFFEILENNKAECGYGLYAYMLSDMEIRLLIKVGEVSLENIFKRLCVKYTYWYNCKYQRNGSLFFDRFKSEPVETDAKFDDVFKYIVKYPQHMGICKDFKEYRYSNIKGEVAVDIYRTYDDSFFKTDTEAEHLAVKRQSLRMTDERAAEIILEVMKKNDLEEVKNMPAAEKYLKTGVLINEGIGYRQLSRLAGMNYVTVKNTLEMKKSDNKGIVKSNKRKKQVPVTVQKKPENDIIDFFAL